MMLTIAGGGIAVKPQHSILDSEFSGAYVQDTDTINIQSLLLV